MRKWFIWPVMLFLLGGCASWSLQALCDGKNLARPSFFSQGQTLAAFKVVLTAGKNSLEGILQIKKTGEEVYEAVLFSAAGGYKLMQAQVTPRGTDFLYMAPPADNAVTRMKADSFLTFFLLPPNVYKTCRVKDGLRRVAYEKNGAVYYEYAAGAEYPSSALYRKKFGSVRMNLAQYAPYEEDYIPHYIYYQDGAVEAELILLTLKK